MFRRMLGPLPYCFLSLMVACSPAKPEESSGGGKDAGQGGTDSWLDEEGPCEELEDLRTQANPNSAVGDRCAMARLPRELRWIFHPDTWEFVPDSSDVQGEDAYLYGSRPAKVRMPKLAWKSCGNGCEKADLWTGIGRPIVGLGSVIVLPSFIPYSTQKKGFLLHKSVGGGTWEISVGWSPEGWKWSLPALEDSGLGLCPTEWLPNGQTFFFCRPEPLLAMLEPGSSEIERLDSSAVGESANDGEWVVWTEPMQGKQQRIRGWTADGRGVRTVVPAFDGRSFLVAIGGDSISGFVGGGVDAGRTPHYFWTFSRAERGRPRMGPVLWPGVMVGTAMATWNEWIAVGGGLVKDEDPVTSANAHTRVALSRSADWETRWIGEAEGFEAIYDLTLTSTHLYVVPTEKFEGWGRTREVYRYDLSQFESLGKEGPVD